ncbi:anaerobic ribonucleoside-triphosphate reductase, partial [Thermoproteota archaeon]
MQPASRKVRTIYSVIASSNRLEILRILNTKGPLSYSELKTLAGFKSKKESGKFAYHLRKLVRQMLITLNRQERKYTVTSLGRLVLNVTRQIEEQSVVESGKLYVRTSRQTMEEFNSDKILQSLVKEAGMPVELAQRITSETEARLYKFQTIYLTAPLIREMVNALLVEHGLEEYRHKLTRLGLPIYDISELVNNTGFGDGDVGSVLSMTASAVFSEYLMLSQLPRDVTDAHLAGEIHITNGGSWGLMPDTIFYDLEALRNNGIDLKGKLTIVPRIEPPKKLNEALNILVNLIALLSKEVSAEISLENFTSYLAEFSQEKTKQELKESIKGAFMLIPSITSGRHGNPIVSLQIGKDGNSSKYDEALIKRVLEATLSAYEEYVNSVSEPTISLVFTVDSNIDSDIRSMLTAVIFSGGRIGISNQLKSAVAYSGLRRDGMKRFPADNVKVLHALS